MVKFLTACAQVEDKAAEIYRTMAADLADRDEELTALWRLMAADEEDHAQQVRFAARLSRASAFEQLNDADKEAPFALLKRADALLNRVKAGGLSEREMLQVALELEKHFRQVHTTYTLLFQETSMKNMFDKLARADETHLEGLKDRIKRFAGELAAGSTS